MSDKLASTGSKRVSRRTVAAGAAWAVPAVAVATAAPMAAASVSTTTTTTLPCVSGIVNDSIEWEVDNVAYAGCNCPSHVDVRLKFNITASNCPYERVEVRVRNYGNPSTVHARWCWTGNNDWLAKYAVIDNGTVTYPRQRLLTSNAEVNDALYFPARQTNYNQSGGGWVTDDLGSCTADGYVGTNDGMHINPCDPGPYFEYQVRYMTGGVWGTWGLTQTWGDTTLVPPPAGCGPAPVLSLDSNTCVNNPGTNNDRRTITVSWTGTANRLQRSTNGTQWGNTVTVGPGNTHTYWFNDSNCNSTYYFRVYQNGTNNYSNVIVVTPTTIGSAQSSSPSVQQSQSDVSESLSESRTTDSSTTDSSTTDSSTTDSSTTDSSGDAPSAETTDQ